MAGEDLRAAPFVDAGGGEAEPLGLRRVATLGDLAAPLADQPRPSRREAIAR